MKYLILGSIFFVSIGWYNSQITNPNSCARFSTNDFSIPDCINGDYELVFGLYIIQLEKRIKELEE